MAALVDLSATELITAYRAGTLTPVEVVRATLDHIAAWEPALAPPTRSTRRPPSPRRWPRSSAGAPAPRRGRWTACRR